MKLKPFGDRETSWSEPSLSDVIGHVETLIGNEDDRTKVRKFIGILDVRLEIVEKAHELLQVAENADAKIMRATLRELKQGND